MYPARLARMLVGATLLWACALQAVESPLVFVTPDGKQTSLAVDAKMMEQLRESIALKTEQGARLVPLRLDCAALDRLRKDMRKATPPVWQRAAPGTGQSTSDEGAADLKHQQQQTRAWLDGLERRFSCGSSRSEQR